MIQLLKDLSSFLGVFFAGLAAWFAFRSLQRLGPPITVEVKDCTEFLAFIVRSKDYDINIAKIEFGKYRLGKIKKYTTLLNKNCEHNIKTTIEVSIPNGFKYVLGEEINYKLFTDKGIFSGNTKILRG